MSTVINDTKKQQTGSVSCPVCFHHCELKEGQRGRCLARVCRDGKSRCDNYGLLSSLALDPIEKKPLARFFPGSRILSVGSYGCNLHCPFCQNHEISHPADLNSLKEQCRYVSPEELCALAEEYVPRGNIGVAFTYNEPLVGYEYVLDCAELLHARGLKTVLVTAGLADKTVAEALRGKIDAMNIDLKSFREGFYTDLVRGDLETVKQFIRTAAEYAHVELTKLIIPGENDSAEEMEEMADWIASLPGGSDIPLHVSRFFPRYRMTDRPPTDTDLVYRLADTARKKLRYVYTGNC
ncbi:MAG: AmmeMemoRadiSam system radical SAM enzyme [Lachnospiraceae bacterium]|nr:AmmeMemoRadiSam system radical SAM enzyme [Lachnospiraceae bacterium]